MVIMSSGIARGRVRTTATTTTESRNMAVILQITGWERDMKPWFTCCILLWYWTSMFWSTDTCQNKVSADQYHVTISRAQVNSSSRSSVFLEVDRWPGAGFSIGSRAYVWLTCWKQSRIVWKPVNAHPGLSINRIITFSSMQCFCCFFCVYGDYINSKQKAKQYTENSAKLQNSNQNSTFSWVSLIGFWTTRFRSYSFKRA